MSFRGLGQFYPADSVLHRLDPRAKILAVALLAVGLFIVESITALLLVGVGVAALSAVGRISYPEMLRMMRPVIFIAAFAGVFQVLFVRQGELLLEFWVLEVHAEGLRLAVFLPLRILVLVSAAALLTATTSPLALTDGMEDLMSPLKRIRFPAHEVAMMMTIAMRFIPTLYEEGQKITKAQAARGADFASGGLISRVRAMLPVLIPLTVGAFSRADELAEAMESRGYTGGEGRSRYRELAFRGRDALALAVAALVPVGGVIWRFLL